MTNEEKRENILPFPCEQENSNVFTENKHLIQQEISTLDDSDFAKIWNSNIDEVVILKSYVESKIEDYQNGLEYEITDYIDNGIGDIESPFFSSVMKHFSDNIERDVSTDKNGW